jgi:hypothetical protein
VEQVVFFGLKNLLSAGFFLAFLFGGLLYLYPYLATA